MKTLKEFYVVEHVTFGTAPRFYYIEKDEEGNEHIWIGDIDDATRFWSESEAYEFEERIREEKGDLWTHVTKLAIVEVA